MGCLCRTRTVCALSGGLKEEEEEEEEAEDDEKERTNEQRWTIQNQK